MKKATDRKPSRKQGWLWFVGLYLAGTAALLLVVMLLKFTFGFVLA